MDPDTLVIVGMLAFGLLAAGVLATILFSGRLSRRRMSGSDGFRW